MGLAILMMIGCKGTREIVREVPVYVHDTTHEKHTEYVFQRDTVINNTETIVREANRGDSALLAQLGLQLRDNEKTILVLRNELMERIQMMEQSKSDSTVHNSETPATITETEYVEVEKKLRWWQKVFMVLGIWTAIVVLVFAAWIIIKEKHGGSRSPH